MNTPTQSNKPEDGKTAPSSETEIFSRFGTRITPLTKPDGEGFLKCVFHFEEGDSEREIHLGDIRAAGGFSAIGQILDSLPDFPAKGGAK